MIRLQVLIRNDSCPATPASNIKVTYTHLVVVEYDPPALVQHVAHVVAHHGRRAHVRDERTQPVLWKHNIIAIRILILAFY